MLNDLLRYLSQQMGSVGTVFYTIGLYFVIGICEIGGGWFIWQVLREEKPIWWIIPAGFMLITYGFIACFQVLNFGTAYATYGGFFVLSIVWAWVVDKQVPMIQDYIGGAICILGASIIAFIPNQDTLFPIDETHNYFCNINSYSTSNTTTFVTLITIRHHILFPIELLFVTWIQWKTIASKWKIPF